ncbi:MAG: hypothetical protein J5786_01555 [Clostridiales bacterium]|nr:hypothetical protein [Clostridiales bacterium]
MKKNYSEMSDHDLLVELLKEQKKESTMARISMTTSIVVVLGVLISLGILVPKLYTTVNSIESSVKEMDVLVQTAQTSLTNANQSMGNIDTMINNVNSVVVDNTQSLTEAVGNIKAIDIQKLNESIQDLSNIVGPLARLFGTKPQ